MLLLKALCSWIPLTLHLSSEKCHFSINALLTLENSVVAIDTKDILL